MSNFNPEQYTRDSIVEELLLTERHARDGSAVEGGCGCIEEKHLSTIIALCKESATLMNDPEERDFYLNVVAPTARELRTKILNGDFKKKVNCESLVKACVSQGRTEGECRSVYNCKG